MSYQNRYGEADPGDNDGDDGDGRFHKKECILENVRLTLDKGQTVGIMGGSGKGKTTLGLLMAGVIRPDKGKFSFLIYLFF